MYPTDGQGQRRSHRAPQPQDNNYGFYNQSPQPPQQNGMHQVVDAYHNHPQSPQTEPQQGYPKYGYDNYAPAMPQYAQNSPQGHFVNSNSRSQRQMGQQSMQNQNMQSPNMQSQNMQNQFYASAWDQPTSMPNSYPPHQQHQQPNGMAPLQHSVNQQLPPSNFYNPNPPAHQQHGGGGAQRFGGSYVQQTQQPGVFGGPAPSLQNAVPLMMAGMRLAGAGVAGGPGGDAAALGAQLFQTFAPGAAGYTNQILGNGRQTVNSFMRLPKYYFTVNHRYVLRKLLLLLKPWGTRTWARQRAVDPSQFGEAGTDGMSSYLPPRDDVNAPDLYIPVMAFSTYVLLVGFMYGVRDEFKAELLARHFSKGAGVLCLEAAIIKLGLYLINAKPTPWLDVIAYRGYKFVGVALTMAVSLVMPKLYWPVLAYSASMMGLFLMRSHRRIVIAREAVNNPADLARRNAFLLFLCVLQYPIYWVLVKY